MITVVCYVCRQQLPPTFEHEHHEIPQATGGRDKGTRKLCASCHHAIHRIQTMMVSGKTGEVEDAARILYPNHPGAMRRCLELAALAASYTADKRDGVIGPNDTVKLQIEVPYAVKMALQSIAAEMKNPVTRKKIGVSGLASKLLCELAYEKFPGLRASIVPPKPKPPTKLQMMKKAIPR